MDEQSMKLLNTQVAGGTTYTDAFLVSLGDTAYMLGNVYIVSHESVLFEVYDNNSGEDPFDAIVDGGIITNLQYVSGSALAEDDNHKKEANDG
jgi:hypothetical protein